MSFSTSYSAHKTIISPFNPTNAPQTRVTSAGPRQAGARVRPAFGAADQRKKLLRRTFFRCSRGWAAAAAVYARRRSRVDVAEVW